MELDSEQAAAQINIDLLIKRFPTELQKREGSFAEKIHKAKLNPLKKLEALYGFMDEVYQFVHKFTPCKKGCNACCYYPISISEIEIQYIAKKFGKKPNLEYLPVQNVHGHPCPFLVNGTCSIYSARPYVCRRHVALTKTNTWCDPMVSNEEYFQMPRFSGLDSAFTNIRLESGSGAKYDIRQVFG